MPANKAVQSQANSHEARLSLHCELQASNEYTRGRGVGRFLQYVKKLLPDDKFLTFCDLLRNPYPTVSITKEIFDRLKKVFESQDALSSYEFVNSSTLNDFLAYRDELGIIQTLKSECWQRVQTSINSIVIVDATASESQQRTEPYFYFEDWSCVKGYELSEDKDSCFEWILVEKVKGSEFLLIDDSFFYELSRNENAKDLRIENQYQHDLKYCPVRFMWTSNLGKKDLKKSPISEVLADLDQFLFYAVSNEHLNLYARFPIVVSFNEDCEFSTDKHYCEDGYLKSQETGHTYLAVNGNPLECPQCSIKKMGGAGSYITVDAPSEENGGSNIIDAVKIIGVDRSSLEYNNEDLEARKNALIKTVTGFGAEPLNNQAINEKQVVSFFESMEGSLKEVQSNFEMLMEWLDKVLSDFRYGVGALKSVKHSLGTKHFLLNSSQIIALYNEAKQSGISDTILDYIQDMYIETEFRNNDRQKSRQKLLVKIDPFRHLSKTEVKEMYQSGAINFDTYFLKMNFSTLVSRFEMDNINILDFGSILSMDEKVKRIRESLINYSQEYKVS